MSGIDNRRKGNILTTLYSIYRTVLYVLTALSERQSSHTPGLNLPPGGSQKYYSAIVDNFMNLS